MAKTKALKTAYYQGNIALGKVVYVFFGKKCVFSGIKSAHSTSTINAAEAILEAISEAEGIHPLDYTFYDLQTCSGYDMEAGEYEYDRLVFDLSEGGQIQVKRWIKTECPQRIMNAFWPYIHESLDMHKILPVAI